jgi:hypothetical protein
VQRHELQPLLLRLRGGCKPSKNHQDDDLEEQKESFIDKIKGLARSIAETITKMRGNQTEEEVEPDSKKRSKTGADAQPRNNPTSPERSRLIAIQRLIDEQKIARGKHDGGGRRGNDDEESVLAVLMPNSQPNALQGFVAMMLAHPLIFLMGFDVLIGLATCKLVPAEVEIAGRDRTAERLAR